MKKIDSDFRHLPEHKALRAMQRQKDINEGAQVRTAQLKADDNGPRQEREQLLKVDRRKFLDLVSKSGISAGLLRAFPLIGGVLSNRYALAQENPHANKRVVYCYVSSGDNDDSASWLPSNVGDRKRLSSPYADLNVAKYCHFRQLHTIAEGHGGAMSAIGGPSNYGNPGPTIDARIAKVLGATSPIQGLYLGSGANSFDSPQYQYISNMGTIQQDPAAVQRTILGMSAPQAITPDRAVLLAFDEQMRALAAIKSKLSAEEYQRFQEHAEKLVRMKTDYETATSRVPYTQVEINAANVKDKAKSHARIIASALASGVTNVATLQIGNAQGDWSSHEYGGSPHCAHSGGNAYNQFLDIHRYCYDASAYLLQLLEKTNGPDGTPLLTSTVFAQVTCFGRANSHGANNAPFALATQRPEFVSGFSSNGQHGNTRGSVRNFHNDIVKGLGLASVVTANTEAAANINVGLLR
ncbi:MAG: DUF1552 domain-containing protein [Gammaproteobacteria bacterium]|nr:DUF1552 domain-containing protein [Gammaproteobacteria bacterium]